MWLTHLQVERHHAEKLCIDIDDMLDVWRYSKDQPRFSDTLDIIKFICKDFWNAVFRKQVDNLKTNHKVQWWSIVVTDGICCWCCAMANVISAHVLAVQGHVTDIIKQLMSDLGLGVDWCMVSFSQGVYVLQDIKFSWFQHISHGPSLPEENSPASKLAEDYVLFPCGLICGALTHFGVSCTVQADLKELPSCEFGSLAYNSSPLSQIDSHSLL